MTETVKVRARVEQDVELPIAKTLCNDFIEWLSTEGLLMGDAAREWKGRDYEQVATEFIEQYA
jgi:hypothetical protein